MNIDTEQFYRKYWGMESFPSLEKTPHLQYIEMLDAFKCEINSYRKNPNALQILATHGVRCRVHELEELIDDENAVLKLKFCLEAIEYALSLSKPEKEEEWIPTKQRLPEFDTPVIVYCRIYGRYIATYKRIDEDYDFGNWHDGKTLGVLPPTHWQYINFPSPPNPNR